jgi:mRNA-degrading endonuclease RelE of RelBE toxin-antitoxin system
LYTVKYQPKAAAELNDLRAFDRVRILDAISRDLTHSPEEPRGRRKRLALGAGGVIWQLRVGDFRVFYDVDEAAAVVIVRHVRRKGRKTTGEIR